MANDFVLESRIGDFITSMNVKKERTASETAFAIRESMIRGMQKPKSGKPNPRKGILRSAPGESPAIDYGTLVNSIFVIAVGDEAIVGTNDDKALRLEFGGINVAARPFFGPAFEEAAEGFQAKLQEIVE